MPAEGPASDLGGKINNNTVYPKDPAAMTASDRLRLAYVTGQDADPNAPRDPKAFRDEYPGGENSERG